MVGYRGAIRYGGDSWVSGVCEHLVAQGQFDTPALDTCPPRAHGGAQSTVNLSLSSRGDPSSFQLTAFEVPPPNVPGQKLWPGITPIASRGCRPGQPICVMGCSEFLQGQSPPSYQDAVSRKRQGGKRWQIGGIPRGGGKRWENMVWVEPGSSPDGDRFAATERSLRGQPHLC